VITTLWLTQLRYFGIAEEQQMTVDYQKRSEKPVVDRDQRRVRSKDGLSQLESRRDTATREGPGGRAAK
jgi:hypothetical protein